MSDYLNSAVFEHRFWLLVLGDHSSFIHDSLYPSEIADIAQANSFIHLFDQLHSQIDSLNDTNAVIFANAAEDAAKSLREYKLSLIERHITGHMNIHLPPTFINHMVNELEEYLRVLSYLKQKKTPPIYHELHHHLIWLVDAAGHAGAINDNLDGVEKRLKEKSNKFTKHFEQFYLKAIELTGYLRTNIKKFPALNRFNHEAALEIELFKTFLHEIEEMELSAEVLGTFSASMADHMLREEQYYLMKLAESINN